jgi:ATP-dependent phosphofructokinase / diphosphate-dependent phosphofructokinase
MGTTDTLLVGQSGGATAVINASLIGVVEGALGSGTFERVLGMRNGIEGLLGERFVDLGAQPREVLARVKRTPSAALGTGRRKLRAEEIDHALDLLKRHGVRAFAYIGGNDSADTAPHRLRSCRRLGAENDRQRFAGDGSLSWVSVAGAVSCACGAGCDV